VRFNIVLQTMSDANCNGSFAAAKLRPFEQSSNREQFAHRLMSELPSLQNLANCRAVRRSTTAFC
jgi:hypothetical protein